MTVTVPLPQGGYPVHIQPGALRQTGALLAPLGIDRWAVTTDETVAALYGGAVLDSLRSAGLSGQLLTFPAGEAHKTPETWLSLCRQLAQEGFTRSDGLLALGGGVTIDLIHEWDYLVELFGVPEKLYNFKGTYSELEIDSDDLSVYIAKYPTLLAEVHLDYFGRGYRRSIELFCRDGSYLADFGKGTLTLPDGTVQHYEEDVNRRYEREMEYFVDYALTGCGESCNPPALALKVLKLTLGENVQ